MAVLRSRCGHYIFVSFYIFSATVHFDTSAHYVFRNISGVYFTFPIHFPALIFDTGRHLNVYWQIAVIGTTKLLPPFCCNI